MKTSVFRKFAVLAAAALVMAAGTSAQTAKPDELNTAIRGASDYLNSKIPKGSKIVVLNVQSNSPELSDYIIDELIANAVNDKVFTVVNRKQLDDIRKEQMFQMSGEVDDKDALAIGRFFGAQTIVSGVVGALGTMYSLRINALEVQTAQVQGQFNKNIASSQIISSLLGNGSSTHGSYSNRKPTQAAPARSAAPAAPPILGIVVPGESLADKLAWLKRSAESYNTYILEVKTDESIDPYTFEYRGGTDITIVLRGIGANRTVRLQSQGSMFKIPSDITFVLDNNITLYGQNRNPHSLVTVIGGIFIMNAGTAITGNLKNTADNTAGGGVGVDVGTFTMNGGTISGNSAKWGAGVYVNKGTFAMKNGTISGNRGGDSGGGVQIDGTFTMSGGIISDNSAKWGGGTYVGSTGTFTMKDGAITGNIAGANGGGVYVGWQKYKNITFTKTGGVITGYNDDQRNGNVVRDEDGVLARRGHAVYVTAETRKETTAGRGMNLSCSRNGASGAWDR